MRHTTGSAGAPAGCNGEGEDRFAHMEPESRTEQQAEAADATDGGRISRVAGEVRGLVEDVRTWVDLKLKLLEVEVEERIREFSQRVALTAAVAVMAFLSLVFVLVTVALGLGLWWDSMFLGFAAVTALLVLATGILQAVRPRLVRSRRKPAEPAEAGKAVGAAADRPRLQAPPPDGSGEAPHG